MCEDTIPGIRSIAVMRRRIFVDQREGAEDSTMASDLFVYERIVREDAVIDIDKEGRTRSRLIQCF